jgi:hypothetical protein
MDAFRRAEAAVDPAEQQRLFAQILALNRQHCWVIGIFGGVPDIVLVRNSFLNVPQVANQDWAFRGPSNTAPECYAIDPSRLH